MIQFKIKQGGDSMNTKKVVSLILAMLLTVSMIACAKGNSKPSSETTSKTETSTKTEAASTAKPEVTKEPQKEATAAPQQEATAAPQQEAAAPKKDWNGVITVVQSGDLTNMDPTGSSNTLSKNILKNMVNRLFETGDVYETYPILLESFEQTDELTWKFKLFDNITFFDGTKMTSDDVIFSLTRAKEKSSTGKTLLKPVESIEKVSDTEFIIHTSSLYLALPTALSNTASTILSKAWVEKADAGQCDWEDVMRNGASGRYYLGERDIGNSVTLLKYDKYFNPEDAAKNDKLIFRIVPEATTRTIMVQTGEADVNASFDTAQMNECLADPNVKVMDHWGSTEYMLWLNTATKFSDKKLRQAIAYAINREDCLEVGADGFGTVWENLWAPNVEGALKSNSNYGYNPEKSKELLKELGITNFEFTAACRNDAEERVAQVVQSYLAQIGITMKYERISSTIQVEAMANNQYDACFSSWGCYNEPELFVGRVYQANGIGGSNYSHYTNPEVEQLMEEANATNDLAKRTELYTRVNQIIMDDCPGVGLYNGTNFCLARSDIKGVNVSVETTYWFHTICY